MSDFMKTFQGYRLITPNDLHWRSSNLMKIPNADHLERTGRENMGARLWRLPPRSANTLHKHIRAEEFYFVLMPRGIAATSSRFSRRVQCFFGWRPFCLFR